MEQGNGRGGGAAGIVRGRIGGPARALRGPEEGLRPAGPGVKDMEKLESPFVRKMVDGAFVVTEEMAPGMEWVFRDRDVLATEKIDGTNVSVVVEAGRVASVWNRANPVPLIVGDWRVMEGLVNAAKKGYLALEDGQHFGELVGPNVNGNPLRLEAHLWVPLSYLREHCAYKSFHEHPKTFENLVDWLAKPVSEGGIFSLYLRRRGVMGPPEGIVFWKRSTGQMAKLRRDMLPGFAGRRHKEGD